MISLALKKFVLGGLAVLSCAVFASAKPAIEGRWRLDPSASSALDGWTQMDLSVALDGSKVALTYHMQWRATRHDATNVLDTAQPVELTKFFRVEQRHMATYPTKGGVTKARAEWIDGGATLRTEVFTPVEVSQGDVTMRITSEFRVSETGDKLTLIELHSSRNRPLVYVFTKVKAEDAK